MTVPPGAVPEPDLSDVDPTDPAQQLDDSQDFHIEPLEVNAMPEAERQDDVDAAIGITSSDEDEDEDVIDDDELTAEERTAKADDVGELYGVHMPPAQDVERGEGPELGEYVEADAGQTWLETLETDSTQGGPVPEHEVDPNDDSDHHGGHHATESGDRPVADKGSGGPGGL